MREILKQPIVWIMVVATLLGGAAIAGTTGIPASEVNLDDPALSTSTVFDAVDEADQDPDRPAAPASGTVQDITDEPAQIPPELESFEAIVIADPADQCIWLVNVTDQNPARLFLVAWPNNTVVSWDPLKVSVDTSDFRDGSPLTGAGLIYPNLDASGIDADDERLAGTGSCESDGFVELREAT